MASKGDKSQAQPSKTQPLDPTLNPAGPYYWHPTDTGLKIIPNVFTGVGFKNWKRSFSIALSGKNKLGFVDGTVKRSTSSAV